MQMKKKAESLAKEIVRLRAELKRGGGGVGGGDGDGGTDAPSVKDEPKAAREQLLLAEIVKLRGENKSLRELAQVTSAALFWSCLATELSSHIRSCSVGQYSASIFIFAYVFGIVSIHYFFIIADFAFSSRQIFPEDVCCRHIEVWLRFTVFRWVCFVICSGALTCEPYLVPEPRSKEHRVTRHFCSPSLTPCISKCRSPGGQPKLIRTEES